MCHGGTALHDFSICFACNWRHIYLGAFCSTLHGANPILRFVPASSFPTSFLASRRRLLTHPDSANQTFGSRRLDRAARYSTASPTTALRHFLFSFFNQSYHALQRRLHGLY